MTDIAEQAAYHEQLSSTIAIRLSQAAIERDRRETCIDCGGKIPEGRISCRCVPCQTELENKGLTRRR